MAEGTLSVAGGSGAEGVATWGGDGGYVSLFGVETETSVAELTISVAGGSGDTAANNGEGGAFYRDGFDATDSL